MRREGPGARAARPRADGVGGGGDGRARPDPGSVREGASARGHPDRRLPARDDRDREPRRGADGGRGGGLALRVQSPVDAGRRRGRPVRAERCGRVRDQGRGQRDVLPAHRGGARPASADHDGRRRRPRVAPAPPARGSGLGGARGDRGDDDRRDPAPRDGRGRRSSVPDRVGERRRHQAPVRQPLRHRTVHRGRDHALDQPAAGRSHVRRGRVRDVRTRRGLARTGDGGPRRRHRGGSAAGARSDDGGLSGHAAPRGGSDRRRVRDGHRRHRCDPARAPRGHEGRRGARERRPLRRRDRQGRARRALGWAGAPDPRVRGRVHDGRRAAPAPARRGAPREPGRRRRAPGGGDGYVVREPGALGRVDRQGSRHARARCVSGSTRHRCRGREAEAPGDGYRDRRAHDGAARLPELVASKGPDPDARAGGLPGERPDLGPRSVRAVPGDRQGRLHLPRRGREPASGRGRGARASPGSARGVRARSRCRR